MFDTLRDKRFHTIVKFCVIASIAAFFCYFRLRPMLFQTVGYTYDQGRDFLKAAEIFLYHNPTFIGPTTGIQGIFHGVWWFYVLAGIFPFTGGSPIGFYYGVFVIQAITAIIFYLFTRKQFGFTTAAILTLILASSGHFIFTTIFIANNILAGPFVLILAIATILLTIDYHAIRIPFTKLRLPVITFVGLSLGFITEFEFAFGLMIIPIYLLLLAAFRYFKHIHISLRDSIFLFTGLAIPFAPRLLFELKNGFPQTQVLFSYIFHPKYFTPKPYGDIWHDRVEMFKGYFYSLYPSDFVKVCIVLFLAGFIVMRIYRRHCSIKSGLTFITLLVTGLFLVSTLYKDTFWSYYYDGIQYLFLMMMGYCLTLFGTKKRIYYEIAKSSLILILLITLTVHVLNDMRKPIVYDGIQVQQDIVKYVQSQVDTKKDYCVIIYTPPVFSYTYDYLFLYREVALGIKRPTYNWDSSCWLIIEHDDNNERLDLWIKERIPTGSKLLKKHIIKDVSIEQWKK